MIEYLTLGYRSNWQDVSGRLLMAPISITAKTISGEKPRPLRGVEQPGFTSPYAMTAIRKKSRDFACLMVPSPKSTHPSLDQRRSGTGKESLTHQRIFRSSVRNGERILGENL